MLGLELMANIAAYMFIGLKDLDYKMVTYRIKGKWKRI